MRRAALLAQLARSAHQCSASSNAQGLAPASAAAARHLSSAHPPAAPAGDKTPLQTYMPMLIGAFPAVYNAAKGAATGLVGGVLHSGAAKSAVTAFADNALVSGAFLDLKDLDLAQWSAWLAAGGYTSQAGWAKIAEAAREQVGAMTPAEAAALGEALHAVGVYDKELFASIAALVKDRFMEFETRGLVKLVPAFADNDAYEEALFDDIADGITYCNHFFAPMHCDVQDVAAVFKAFAKYGHDRADLFVALSRGLLESRLKELDDKQLASTLMDLLAAFDRFGFWPDATEGLFVVAEQRAAALGEADRARVAGYVAKVEALAGALPYYRGGHKDPDHFAGPGWGQYNLYCMRDELVPQYYKPTDIRALRA